MGYKEALFGCQSIMIAWRMTLNKPDISDARDTESAEPKQECSIHEPNVRNKCHLLLW